MGYKSEILMRPFPAWSWINVLGSLPLPHISVAGDHFWVTQGAKRPLLFNQWSCHGLNYWPQHLLHIYLLCWWCTPAPERRWSSQVIFQWTESHLHVGWITASPVDSEYIAGTWHAWLFLYCQSLYSSDLFTYPSPEVGCDKDECAGYSQCLVEQWICNWFQWVLTKWMTDMAG